ncbi:MAG: hypothetical protein HUU22_12030 [Phycisphaerae bacterium]|nr:hypothetical protein [Phycisphaerae bacterium]NUQ46745.1 hypothetical protein [Phycisphaerae bacterium]
MASRQTKPQQTGRMAVTLVALIVAMIAATSLMNWVHGLSSTPRAARGNPPLLRSEAPAWSRIVIHAAHENQPRPFHHFYIDSSGAETESAAWAEGQQDPALSRSVYLLVAYRGRDQTGGVSRQQWETLVSRIRALQRRFAIRASDVVLDFDSPHLSRAQREELRQLHRMLQTVGVAS